MQKDSPRATVNIIADEGLSMSRQGIGKILQHVVEQGNLERVPGSGQWSKVTPRVKAIVEVEMRHNDKTTVLQLSVLHYEKGHRLSESSILRIWFRLDGHFRAVHTASDANKA